MVPYISSCGNCEAKRYGKKEGVVADTPTSVVCPILFSMAQIKRTLYKSVVGNGDQSHHPVLLYELL